MRLRSLLALAATPWLAMFATATLAAEPAIQAPQIILLKLDDVTAHGARGSVPVSARWQRIADFIDQRRIKASFGIICSSLEGDQPAYFAWIKERQAAGRIEFWLHGYYDRKATDPKGEFEVGAWDEQRAVLEKSERLACEKLGFPLVAFGPHWSGVTDATDQALEAVPEIKIWLYGPKSPKHFQRLSLERVMALEDPTFVPDSNKFRANYERLAANRDVLVLQGHPNNWDDARWDGFVRIIDFLESRGCVFATPSEYLAVRSAKH